MKRKLQLNLFKILKIDTTVDKPKVEVDQEIDQNEELDSISIEKAIIEKEAEIDDQRNKSILKVEWKFPLQIF